MSIVFSDREGGIVVYSSAADKGEMVKASDGEGEYDLGVAEHARRKAVETAAHIGAWYSQCCEQDLYQIEDKAELDEVLEGLWDRDSGWWYRVWETREEAMAQLTADGVTGQPPIHVAFNPLTTEARTT